MAEPKLEWATHWIAAGASWKKADGEILVLKDPATGEPLGETIDMTAAGVDTAVAAAVGAFRAKTWTRLPQPERAARLRRIGQLIRDHRAELATLESLNNGKTFKESWEDDLPESADVFDYYAGWIDKIYGDTCPVPDGFLNYTRREPVGPCALIVPWNFPLLLAAWKIAPALAMGNTVVVKPSPFTPYSLVRLTQLIEEADVLPPGTFNLVLGGAEAGKRLAEHPDLAKISFTGSTPVGKAIVRGAAETLKSVSLELGGKSACLLFEDTPEPEAAISRCFNALFSHKGEKCSEPTRFLVHRKLYDRFVERFREMAAARRLGNPFSPDTEQGPQCHEAHFRSVLGYIESGKREGARLVAGGSADGETGYYVRPTVFADVKPEMKIAREEIFGPVAVVMPFDDEAKAIEIANGTPYGLAAGLYTAEASRALRVADQLDAGMVFVNHYGCYHFSSPFGGFKQSGWGKEMALHSLDAYTKVKSVWIKY